jgi:hypothetical protein
MNTTERGQQKLNLSFLIFHPISMQILSNDNLDGLLMNHQNILLFDFEKRSKRDSNSEILHIWKAYLTLKIVKEETYPKYSGSSILLCSVQYCDQQFTVSNKIL